MEIKQQMIKKDINEQMNIKSLETILNPFALQRSWSRIQYFCRMVLRSYGFDCHFSHMVLRSYGHDCHTCHMVSVFLTMNVGKT